MREKREEGALPGPLRFSLNRLMAMKRVRLVMLRMGMEYFPLHINGPSEVAGGVNVSLHVNPLVMVRGNESGDRGADGVNWWAVDVHDVCTIWAGWVDEE